MSNAKGFGAVGILVVILVIRLMGTIGWLVYDRQASQVSQDTSKPTVDKQDKKTEATSTSETKPTKYQTKDGYSFELPKGWKVTESTGAATKIVTITSPDHSEVEGGYGGTKTGAVVTVVVSDQASGNSVSSILDGTYTSKSKFTQISETTLDGQKAVEYTSQYEGPAYLIVQVDKDGKSYKVRLEEDVDGPSFNAYEAEYQVVVKSFKFD